MQSFIRRGWSKSSTRSPWSSRERAQPLLDRCYDTGRYAEEVRYDRPPDPPLTPEQQAWAEAILREKGVLR